MIPIDTLRTSMLGDSYYSQRMVINALIELDKKPNTSYDIKNYLDKQQSQEQPYPKNTLSLRQIQRILRKLKEEGILDKKPNSHEYFILDKHQASIRYFADKFGILTLSSIMRDHRPIRYTMKDNLKKL